MIQSTLLRKRWLKTVVSISIVAWLIAGPIFSSASLAQTEEQQQPPGGFGSEAIWDPFDAETPGGAELRECTYAGDDAVDCIRSVMESSGAPSQAVDFVEMTNGEAFMVTFEEKGTVDLAGVVYPGRANGNFQYMLLNGTPPIVRADDQGFADKIELSLRDSGFYESLAQRFPEVTLWIWDSRFEGELQSPSGKQEFVFSYLLRDGCHACSIVAHAFVEFTFDSAGAFKGVRLVTLAAPEDYEAVRARFQSSPDALDTEVGGISYIGEDGNLWALDPSDGTPEPLTEITEGSITAYDWCSERDQLVYVKETDDGKTEIHLLEVGTNQSELLLLDANYDPWGGIALSPSGAAVAFTSRGIDVKVLDIEEMDLRTLFHANTLGLGPGIPSTRRGLNWSADGQHLAVDLYATGAVVLSVEEGVEDHALFRPQGQLSNPTFGPSKPTLAWIDWTEEQESLLLTSRTGEIQNRLPAGDCRLGPNTSLSWAPYGDQIAVSTRDGLCVFDVASGTVSRPISGQGTWNVRWSMSGEWILFRYVAGIGTMGVDAQTLGLIGPTDSALVDLGIRGSMPAWIGSLESLRMPDVSVFLEEKEALIPKLERTSVEIVGVPFPFSAYDEEAARDLVERVQKAVDDRAITPEQAEAFARVTLQEQSLAGMLPLYVQTSADIVEVWADAVTILLSTVSMVTDRLRAHKAAGKPLSGACSELARMVERRAMRVIHSLGDVILGFIPDSEQRRSYQTFWGLLVNGITLELEAGASDVLEDLLLGTVLKGPLVRFLVRRYVRYSQPWLDQGIRSGDSAYRGSEPTWTVEGDLERARIHTDSLVDQAAIKAEYAHSTHEDLMRGSDIVQLVEDIASVGQLTPLADLSFWVNVAAKVEYFAFDTYAMLVNIQSSRCTRYLSSRAGSLAFNPNQPVEGCNDMTSNSLSPSRLARQAASKGDVVAWRDASCSMAGRSERYRKAVQGLLAAVREGDEAEVVDAVRALDEADYALDTTTSQATGVLVNSDVPESALAEALSQSNQFSMDALQLYLLVAGYVTAPEDARLPVEDLEPAAQAALSSLEAYDEALQAAAPTVNESRPLPLIRTVALPDEAAVAQALEVPVVIENIGSTEAQGVVVRSRPMDQDAKTVDVGTLEAGQVQTATLRFQAVHTGTMTLLTEVEIDDYITDNQIDRLVIAPQSPEKQDGLLSRLCLCNVLPLLVGGVILLAGGRRTGMIRQVQEKARR